MSRTVVRRVDASTVIVTKPRGPQGASATIAIGDVQALDIEVPEVENVGTPSAAILDFRFPISGVKGDKGDPGSPGEGYLTRAAMAASTVSLGDDAYLAEPGREGKFIVRAYADYSASVTADTAQGLFVRSTADPTKVFVRLVPDRVYLPEWFGLTPTYGNGANVPLQIMANLIPDGSTVRLPPYTILLDSTVRWDQVGLTITGSKKTLVKSNLGAAYWAVNDRHLFLCTNSKLRLQGFTMEHNYHPHMSGGNFCVLVTANAIASRQIEDVEVTGMTFQNCSEGLVVYCTNVSGTLLPVKRVKIAHCNFLSIDYQATSIFICEDVHFHDNVIKMIPSATARFTPNVRILGSKRVKVHGNELYGSGVAPVGADARLYGFACMPAASGSTRAANRDVHIYGNRVENCRYPFLTDECHGTLTIEDNIVVNDTTSTQQTSFIFGNIVVDNWSDRGNQVDNLVVRNNHAVGFYHGVNVNGRFGRIEIEGNTIEGNAAAAADTMRCVLLAAQALCFYRHVTIRDNKFLFPDGAGNVCIEVNLGAGGFLEVVGNRLPAGTHINGEIYATGSASPTFVTTQSGAGTSTSGTLAMGDNAKYPTGLFAIIRAVRA